MLFLLWAFARYVAAHSAIDRSGNYLPIVLDVPSAVLLIALPLVFALGILAGELASILLEPDKSSGTPRHWFPAVAAFGAACLIWHLPERRRAAPEMLALGQISAVCLIASVFLGGQIYYIDSARLLFSAWVAAAWIVCALVVRSSAWLIGSAVWGAVLVASFNLLSYWTAPVGLASSSLILMLAAIANQSAYDRENRLRDAVAD